MGRRLRNYFPGGIYHLIQRGHNRSFIFNDQLDKAVFLDIVRVNIHVRPCHLLYYVLMDNHYHIILEMLDSPVDEIMREINRTYSYYYNQKYQCSGTVYGGRYKCYMVSEIPYLLRLVVYIANNPVKASIVGKISDYRWGAHLDLVASQPGIVARDRLFTLLGGSPVLGRFAYQQLINKPSAGDTEPRQSDFVQSRRTSQLEILFQASIPTGLTADLIRSRSHRPEIVDFRRSFTSQALALGYTTREIAYILNVTPRSIRNQVT